MKNLLSLFLGMTLVFGAATSGAVATDKEYSFKKGQVIDFLYLIRRPNSDAALQAYFKAAIPIARELGYKPLSSFVVSGKPTQGNLYPENIAVGAWPGDFSDRQKALTKLMAAVPDLHAQRMDIWSSFNMSLYEITESLNFTLFSDKYYVLTAYWQKDARAFGDFKREFVNHTEQMGGTIKLVLEDGRSPFGYEHNPDYLMVSEWQDKAAFDRFLKVNLAMDHAGVKQVNQFPVRAPKPRG